jgi:hypothetical protein
VQAVSFATARSASSAKSTTPPPAAALPGLSENDKVMSGQYEARPKDDLHNTLSKHR